MCIVIMTEKKIVSILKEVFATKDEQREIWNDVKQKLEEI